MPIHTEGKRTSDRPENAWNEPSKCIRGCFAGSASGHHWTRTGCKSSSAPSARRCNLEKLRWCQIL